MKSKKILTILVLALSLMVCLAEVNGQIPLSTAFTYQGFLTEDDRIVNGTFDLRFQLFDAPADGNQVGDAIDEGNFKVEDGHIALELNFGGDVFTGDKRWLQISIRRSAVGGDYNPLAPRLELTLTPYALYALTAEDANTVDGHGAGEFAPTDHNHHSFDAADGSPTDAVYVDNEGNVGIGTTSPTEKFNVVGNARIDGNLKVTGEQEVDGDISAHNIMLGQGQVRDNDNVTAVIDRNNDSNANFFNVLHNGDTGPELFRIQEDGNVGIGTTNPGARLEVAGQVRITGGNPGADRVLTSDASGLASWQAPQLPPGSGVPSGVIVMWAGAIGDIPTGWALCNGNNGTPDLTNMFIVGAGNSYGVGDTGGSATHSHPHRHGQRRWAQDRAYKEGYGGGSTNWNPYEWTDYDNTPASSLPPYYALAYIMKLP